MPTTTEWMKDARRSYAMYGVDLIRTGCLIIRTTPTVTYRAGVLFQRFHAVTDAVRRDRGDYQKENGVNTEETTGCNKTDEVRKTSSYAIPQHVGTQRPSGVPVLGDPYAPLDYSLFYLEEHNDIIYLAAACVLIATKMEDHAMRIRYIVEVFIRLNQRRRGEPVIEELKRPEELYLDFKSSIVEAEGVVLRALGFQTFVECPFKYAIFFLGMLLEVDCEEVRRDPNKTTTTTTTTRTLYSNCSFHNTAFKTWLVNVVGWLNDIPRFVELYAEEAHVLALCSLCAMQPSNAMIDLRDWSLAFGVEKEKVNSVLNLHKRLVENSVHSAKESVRLLNERLQASPCYPKIAAEVSTKRETVEAPPTAGKTTFDAPTSMTPQPSLKQTELIPPLSSAGINFAPVANPPITVLNVATAMDFLGGADPASLHNLFPDVVRGNNNINSNNNYCSSTATANTTLITTNTNTTTATATATITNNNNTTESAELHSNNNNNSNHNNNSNSNNTNRMNMLLNNMPQDSRAPVPAGSAFEDEFHFEDLREMQRRRRQKEAEEEIERRKRRRSDSRRRHHHSDSRRKRRSPSHRRDGSREERKRRSSPGDHKSSRSEQQHQRSTRSSDAHHSRGDRKDDKERPENRNRHDDRSRHGGGKHRNNDKKQRRRR